MAIYTDKDGRDRVVPDSGYQSNAVVRKSIHLALKERELKAREDLKNGGNEGPDKELTLDDSERVKVLSPGQLVFKRFITNKLAIVGSFILIFMFTFSFIVPLVYPYSQTQIFYKYDNSVIDYAQAKERTDYSIYMVDAGENIHYSVKNKLTATINDMKSKGLEELSLEDPDGISYRIDREDDYIYSLYKVSSELYASMNGTAKYATYSVVGKKLEYEEESEPVDGFENALQAAIKDKAKEFTAGGMTFTLEQVKKTYNVYLTSDAFTYYGGEYDAALEALARNVEKSEVIESGNDKYLVTNNKGAITVNKLMGEEKVALLSTYVFDSYDSSFKISDEFMLLAINAVTEDNKFEKDGKSYTVKAEGEERLIYEEGNSDEPVAAFSTMVIRRYNGEDSLEFAYKEKTRSIIEEMTANNQRTATFTWPIAQVDADGLYTYDENGDVIKDDRTVTITDKNGSFVMSVEQVVYLIDTFSRPTKEHWAGTDGDGMDVFARMMYGGRVSLMVAFVVVILETILGIIMGGIAGYFGGWVDNLIMRMVDIFYCIPSMPILIILGAMFDALKLRPIVRITWLMVILGILGWSGVARLVRGQILSLREQEFMVAAEAIGLKNRKRIFKHLIPNVMPQLIVTATSGLGGTIIMESTLSFLGLGVKHPLASWGTMINSVSTAEAMKAYTYIWVPVGLLICLTVIAFNFVGDGLRDAFDPKMKR